MARKHKKVSDNTISTCQRHVPTSIENKGDASIMTHRLNGLFLSVAVSEDAEQIEEEVDEIEIEVERTDSGELAD